MDLSRWPHADALLDEALDLAPGDREAFARGAAMGDADLEAALLAVLREASRSDAFLAPGGALTGPFFAHIVAMRGDLPPSTTPSTHVQAPEPAASDDAGVAESGDVLRGRPFAVPFVLTLAVGTLLGAGAILALRGALGPSVPVTLAVPLPPGDQFVSGHLPNIALARDGQTVVYGARRGDTVQLFRRSLRAGDATPITGTERGAVPFVSDTGRSVAFSRDGWLHVASPDRDAPVAVAAVGGEVSGTWLGNVLVFGGERTGGLRRVSAQGGAVTAVTALDASRGGRHHGLPEVVPGSRVVLFTIWGPGRPQLAATRLDTGEVVLLGEGRQPRVVQRDLLVFVQEDAVWAARFDAARLRLQGEPRRVLGDVATSAITGTAQLATAASGTLVYVPRGQRPRHRILAWVDRSGREEQLPIAPAPFTHVAVSPDGTTLALSSGAPDGGVFVYAMAAGTLTRVASSDVTHAAPVWTPDGQHLLVRSDRAGGGLFRVRADGAGAPVRLTTAGDAVQTPNAVTPDGRTLLATLTRGDRDQGIAAVRLDAPYEQEMLLDGRGAELQPALAPDGRWLAYQSDESGRFEVYVRPYPDVHRRRWQVSTSGGTSPRWTRDGRELLYHHDGAILRATIQTTPAFRAGTPARVVPVGLERDDRGPRFELSPDGQRFLVLRPAEGAGAEHGAAHFTIVRHWPGALRARLPAR